MTQTIMSVSTIALSRMQQNDTLLTDHHKNAILQNDTQIEELSGKALVNK